MNGLYVLVGVVVALMLLVYEWILFLTFLLSILSCSLRLFSSIFAPTDSFRLCHKYLCFFEVLYYLTVHRRAHTIYELCKKWKAFFKFNLLKCAVSRYPMLSLSSLAAGPPPMPRVYLSDIESREERSVIPSLSLSLLMSYLGIRPPPPLPPSLFPLSSFPFDPVRWKVGRGGERGLSSSFRSSFAKYPKSITGEKEEEDGMVVSRSAASETSGAKETQLLVSPPKKYKNRNLTIFFAVLCGNSKTVF